jgi:hypothetical protein
LRHSVGAKKRNWNDYRTCRFIPLLAASAFFCTFELETAFFKMSRGVTKKKKNSRKGLSLYAEVGQKKTGQTNGGRDREEKQNKLGGEGETTVSTREACVSERGGADRTKEWKKSSEENEKESASDNKKGFCLRAIDGGETKENVHLSSVEAPP